MNYVVDDRPSKSGHAPQVLEDLNFAISKLIKKWMLRSPSGRIKKKKDNFTFGWMWVRSVDCRRPRCLNCLVGSSVTKSPGVRLIQPDRPFLPLRLNWLILIRPQVPDYLFFSLSTYQMPTSSHDMNRVLRYDVICEIMPRHMIHHASCRWVSLNVCVVEVELWEVDVKISYYIFLRRSCHSWIIRHALIAYSYSNFSWDLW